MQALVLGYLRSNGLRAFITLVAVALGVAIALAIDLANATALASFGSSVNVVASSVNLQVLGVGGSFDERTLLAVQRVPGVTGAQPVLEDALTLGAKAGDPTSGEILRVLGVDLLAPLPRGANARGDLPGAFSSGGVEGDAYAPIAGRGTIVSSRIAERYHLHAGGPLVALAGDRAVRLNVAAVLPPDVPGVDSSVAFVDVVTAQEIFGKVGRLDRIDCTVVPAQLTAVQRTLARILPHGVRAIEPKVRTGEIRRMLRSFQLNLAALSYIALLVGAFLIYNTVAISVVQRRPEIGTLRALGTTRGRIFRTFLAEGALFGALGSLVGLVLGAFLAHYSVAAVARTVDTLYVGTHADKVVYDPLIMLKAMLVGTLLATFSAAAPALEAARTAPAGAMRSQGYERRIPRGGTRLALAGLGLLLLGWAATRLGPVDGIPLFGYAAGLAFIAGGSLCVPLAVAGTARLAQRVAARLAPAARLAAANLGASPRRTSVAIASLMIAIGMMVSVAILIGSFRTTVVAWADETLKADLFVRPLGLADASYDARFSPHVVERVAALRGVAAVDTLRAIELPFRGSLTTLGAADFRTFATRNKLRLLAGLDAQGLARTLPGSLGAVVSEPFATRFDIKVGDAIPLDTPGGAVTLRVAAIYNDYSSDAGVMLIDAQTYRRLYRDDSVNSLAIYAKPGTDLSELRSRVVRGVLPLRVDVQTTRELRALVIEIFNRTFAITYALYVISIAIAVLGVVSTLFALVLERRREIGILRYLGLSTGAVRRMVLYEAGLVGALGGGFGILLGLLLALLLIFTINRQAFGWLIQLHLPLDFLAEAWLLVIVAAVLAGLYPARVAARIRTADAVRSE